MYYSNLLVIGGGSIMVDGPKNDGTSLDVVTGVFRSPVCDSTWLGWLMDSPLATEDSMVERWCDAVSRLSWGCEEELEEADKEALAREEETDELADDVTMDAIVPPWGECWCSRWLLWLMWCWCCCCWWWWWRWWCWWCWLRLLLLLVENMLLLLFDDPFTVEEVPEAVLNRHVSKLSTLKWAAAADSVSRNAWWDGVTNVSRPSMIIVDGGGPGARPP